MHSTATTSRGRQVTSDVVQLPIGVEAGGLPRLIGFSVRDRQREIAEDVTGLIGTYGGTWLDIGAGYAQR